MKSYREIERRLAELERQAEALPVPDAAPMDAAAWYEFLLYAFRASYLAFDAAGRVQVVCSDHVEDYADWQVLAADLQAQLDDAGRPLLLLTVDEIDEAMAHLRSGHWDVCVTLLNSTHHNGRIFRLQPWNGPKDSYALACWVSKAVLAWAWQTGRALPTTPHEALQWLEQWKQEYES